MDQCISTAPEDDSVVFCSVVISGLLESAVELYTSSLLQMFRDDPEIVRWLNEVWTPEELRHGSLMRDYVGERWPEFDWNYVFDMFCQEYSALCAVHCLRPTKALELLARCVTETEAALYYRTISSYAKDVKLRVLFTSLYRDEVAHYNFFLEKFKLYNRRERNSWKTLAQTIHDRSALVADEDVAIASKYVTLGWRGAAPFDLSKDSIRRRVRTITDEHFPYDAARKMLFKPLDLNSVQKKLGMDSIERKIRAQFASSDQRA